MARITRSAALLQDGAGASQPRGGLSDQSHFTRVFRRATGMSPSASRHQLATAPAEANR